MNYQTSHFPLSERFTFAVADVYENVVEFNVEHFDTGFYDTITFDREVVESWVNEHISHDENYDKIEPCPTEEILNDILDSRDIEDFLTENCSMASISISEFLDLCEDVQVLHLFLVGWMEQALIIGVHNIKPWIARCILFGMEGWTFYPSFKGEQATDIMKLHNYLDKWKRYAAERDIYVDYFGTKRESFKDEWVDFTSELVAA